MVVEWIRDGDKLGQGGPDPLRLVCLEVRELDVERLGPVGDDGGLAAGTAHAHKSVPRERSHRVENQEGVEQPGDRLDAVYAEPVEEGPVGGVAADNRPGV